MPSRPECTGLPPRVVQRNNRHDRIHVNSHRTAATRDAPCGGCHTRQRPRGLQEAPGRGTHGFTHVAAHSTRSGAGGARRSTAAARRPR